jgi:hypothetical protein
MAGRQITFGTGERKGETINVDDEPKRQPAAPGGTDIETGKTESVDEAVDRMSGAPPRSNQSTDHMNQY